MNNISAIIVAKGDPVYLIQSTDSIDDLVAEIIIVDIGLDQRMITKLRNNKKIRIETIDKEIPFVELIREKVKKLAHYPYLLFLDPDEIIPNKLKEIIQAHFHRYDYIKIPRKNIIFGKWIRNSRWWPDYQIRLFKKEMVHWPPVIHTQPGVSGRALIIDPKEEFALVHYNYENLDEYLEKAKRYAKSEAAAAIEHQRDLSFSEASTQAINEFVSRYFAGEGYKDGVRGLMLAFLQMFYPLLAFFYFVQMKEFEVGETYESLKIQAEGFFKRGLKETIYWKNQKTLIEKIIKKLL